MARAELMDFDQALELYEPVIGLEVHVELNTTTKMFSPAPNPANSAFHGAEPNTLVTPRACIAHTLARYGTRCGACSWFGPWRGRKATVRSPTLPIATGAAGGPKGVSTVTSVTSSRKR